jgi:hypothetical protein
MKKTLLCLSVIALVGCSSNKMVSVERVKQNKFDVPTWYTELPKEEEYIFAAASETSTDMQFAIDKAMMSASRDIAFKIKGTITENYKEHSMESKFTKKDALAKNTERVYSAETQQVSLSGIEKMNTVVVREGDNYRAFVLVRLEAQ